MPTFTGATLTFTSSSSYTRGRDSPFWRFALSQIQRDDADPHTITGLPIISFLDTLATDRVVTAKLREPSTITGNVPSDNPEVNIPMPDPDNDPFLAEGNRVLWAFRRESETPPYYICRGAGVILSMVDSANPDGTRTNFTAFDPWQGLYSRPAVDINGEFPTEDFSLQFSSYSGAEIAFELLENTIFYMGDILIDIYAGTIETTENLGLWEIQQGTSVGQALADLIATNTMDIVLSPIYDPNGVVTHILNIYEKAGSQRNNAVMSYDRAAKSLTGMERGYDGANRANTLRFHNGQGGPPSAEISDPESLGKYGEQWLEQFFPYHLNPEEVVTLAYGQLQLLKNGPKTLNIDPGTTNAPSPFTEYYLGDSVPVLASDVFRAEMHEYWRVVEIPVHIDDNGREQVVGLAVEETGMIVPGSGFDPAIRLALTRTPAVGFQRRIGSVRAP